MHLLQIQARIIFSQFLVAEKLRSLSDYPGTIAHSKRLLTYSIVTLISLMPLPGGFLHTAISQWYGLSLEWQIYFIASANSDTLLVVGCNIV